jgi:Tfp pilus assembly protein PilN
MANVNLIATRRADRVRLTRTARVLSLACVLAGGLGLVAVGFMGSQIFMARSAIAGLDQELAKLRPIREQIERDEQERIALQPKIETLTSAQKETQRWLGILEGLKRAVPDQTFLTNVGVEAAGADGKQLKLNGVTDTQARVGETMLRLNGQREFYDRVDLSFTTVNKTDGQEKVEFELKAALHTPEKPAVQGEGNATETN